MEFHVWCILASVLLATSYAERYDTGPQRFFDSSTPFPQVQQRYETKEVVLYLTPSQVQSLEASGVLIRSDNFAEPEVVNENENENENENSAEKQQPEVPQQNEDLEQDEDQEQNEELERNEEPEQNEESQQNEEPEQNSGEESGRAVEDPNEELGLEEIIRILNKQQEEENKKNAQGRNVPQIREGEQEDEATVESRESASRNKVQSNSKSKQEGKKYGARKARPSKSNISFSLNEQSASLKFLRSQQEKAWKQVRQEAREEARGETREDTRQEAKLQGRPQNNQQFKTQVRQETRQVVRQEVRQEPTQETTKEIAQEKQVQLPKYKVTPFNLESQQGSPKEEDTEVKWSKLVRNEEKLAELAPLLQQKNIAEVIAQQKQQLLRNELELHNTLRELQGSPKHNDQKYAIEVERLRANLERQNTLSKAEAFAKVGPVVINSRVALPANAPQQFPTPLEIVKRIPYPVVKTEAVEVDKPVPIEVEKRVPVTVTRNVYVKVNKPYFVERVVPVEVKQEIPVEVPINKPEKLTILRHIWEH